MQQTTRLENQKVQPINPNPTVASISIPDDKPLSPLSVARPVAKIHLFRKDLQPSIQQLQRAEGYCEQDYSNGTYYGQMVNGKKHGKGIMILEGRYCEGTWQNDRKHGLCKEVFDNGDFFEGEFQNGKPQGQGFFKRGHESYRGQFVNGFRHGQGVWKNLEDNYDGEWKFGKIDGVGSYLHGRDKYTGSFRNNLKHGHGVENFANGDVYSGQYSNGKPEGQGTYIWANGAEYRGSFRNGVRHGQGVWTKWDQGKEGMFKYEGTFENDKKHGEGVFTWPSGNKYVGQFMNDYRHGYGEMYWKDQHYKGQWEKGMQHGDGELSRNGITKRGKFENNVMVQQPRSQSAWNSEGAGYNMRSTDGGRLNESFTQGFTTSRTRYMPSIGRKPKLMIRPDGRSWLVDNFTTLDISLENDPEFATICPSKVEKRKKEKRRVEMRTLLLNHFK